MAKVTRSGRRQALSAERITALAFALVDAEGPSALSMRRLATELGCQAMSLYHHVENLDALLDRLVDELLSRCHPPASGAPVDRDSLLKMARDFLRLALDHPRVFQMVVARPWVGQQALTLAMSLVAQFRQLGLEPRPALAAARVLGAYLNGAGTALAGWKLQRTAPPRPLVDAAPEVVWLQQQSQAAAVRADIDAGLELLIDALLPG